MTEKSARQAKSATEASAEAAYQPIDSLLKALRDSDVGIPTAARDFVKRSATSAKDRADSVHAGAETVTMAFENVLTHSIGGVADLSRALLQAAHQNTAATLVAIEKFAAVKSFDEAFQLQVEFIKDRGRASLVQAQDAVELVKRNVTEGAQAIQGEYTKVMSAAKAA